MRYKSPKAITLQGKTVLILGFGHIGQRVAEICLSLKMNLLAVRRQPPARVLNELKVYFHSPNALRSLLPKADILIITLPLTKATRGMIGVYELGLLPAGAILVNVGRGQIVDQAALYQSLLNRQLHAAGLDVWYNYPETVPDRVNTPASDFPFHKLDNVVMSPHRAGLTQETEQLRMAYLARLLNDFRGGTPNYNCVDLEQGY